MKTVIILLFKVIAALANNQSFEDIPFLSDIDNTPLNLKDIIDANKLIEPLSNFCGLRIIGGVEGDLNFLPYQVCLASFTYGAYSCNCGGALITLEYVITAAHCLSHPKLPHYSKFKVIAGSLRSNYLPADFNTTKDDEQYRKIDKIYLHNNYEDSLFRNDIAVFRVKHPFKKTAKVQPVRLHTTNNQVLLREGTNCLVSGYGITDEGTPSKTLRMVCVPLITKSSCRRMIASEFLTSSNFCAGVFGKDSCLGDSGGPIVCQGVLVGLVSFGGKCGVHPGVYTRLLSYTAPDLANLVDDGIADSAVESHVVLRANVFFVNFYTILFTLSVF